LRSSFLPFSPPLIGEEEIAEVVDTLRSDWITTGPKVKKFEEEFAAYLGADSALALSSATAAMHVSLAALGIGPGDAVITTPMTFCSTVHVIEQVGAHPVLVDVEPGALTLDPERVRKEVARRNGKPGKEGHVKALLPVHLYGHPCDMDAMLDIATQYNLALVEDAAHSLPTKYKGCMIGAAPKQHACPILTCFSFYATKNMTTAEGGMLTASPALIKEARIWSLHGMSRDAWKRYGAGGSWYYEVIRPGFKYNMTDLQASIGLHQLRKLPRFHSRRREIVQRYNAAFSGIEGLQVPGEREGVEHAWHLYVLRIDESHLGISRDQFIKELAGRNIGTSVHFIPIHLHPYYRDKYGYKPQDFPVAFAEYQKIVSLPLSPRMTDADTDDVIEAVREIARKYQPASMSS
jgi:dTDP-4-amino-4,6-dideoxygalactose transaminase